MVSKNFIPREFRKDIDLLKDEVVEKLFSHAQILQSDLKRFKAKSFSEIEVYLQLLAEKYSAPYEGKGNLTITNCEGTKKVQRTICEFIQFDEKLQIAKNLIDKCIAKWSNGSRDEIKVLVNFAFEVNKQGKISTERVLSLRRLNIVDEDWQNAMMALADSLNVTGSKSYIKYYYREDEYSAWKYLSLDLATL